MKFYLDKPLNFWGTDDQSLTEHREVYLNLVTALMAMNVNFEVTERRPYLEEELAQGMSDGIYYGYHAAHPGVHSYCIKRGPFPYLWYMDAGGYSGWSAIANDLTVRNAAAQYPSDRAAEVVAHYRREMCENNLTILAQPDDIPEQEVTALTDFIFYPLQVNNDEVMKLADVPQFKAIQNAVAAAETHKRPLVFKRHPQCTSTIIKDLMHSANRSPYVHVTTGSVNTLLQRARAVLVTNSTVGLQALIMGRPVFTLGASEYRHLTFPLKKEDQINQAFKDDLPTLPDNIEQQLGYLLDSYFVDMRDPARIRERIRLHRDAFLSERNIEQNEQATKELSARIFLTLAHRLEKESRERLEFLLASYADLPAAQKPAVVSILAQLVVHGHHIDYIIAHTDAAVSSRCLKILHKRKDYDGAKRVLHARLARNGADSQSLYMLGKLHFELGEKEDGMLYTRKAAEEPSAKPNALSYYLRKLAQEVPFPHDEFRRFTNRLSQVAVESPWAHWATALLALAEGQVAPAQKEIAEAIRLLPEQVSFLKLQQEIVQKASLLEENVTLKSS